MSIETFILKFESKIWQKMGAGNKYGKIWYLATTSQGFFLARGSRCYVERASEKEALGTRLGTSTKIYQRVPISKLI